MLIAGAAHADEVAARQTGVEDETAEAGAQHLDSAAKELEERRQQTWVVQVHPDTGQVYYISEKNNTQSWFNPYEDESAVTQIFSNSWEDWDDKQEGDLENIAGYDFLTDRGPWEEGSEAHFATDRIQKWLKHHNIEVPTPRPPPAPL